jgi:hypothetical protein
VRALPVALTLMDQARARKHGTDLGNRLTHQAFGLLGGDAVLTVIGLQNAGKRPDCGAPAREQVIGLAWAGDAGIGTVILIRDREYVCEGRGARRVREDPAAAVNLAGEMRAMGSWSRGTDRWRSRSPITWSAVRMPRTRPGSATAQGS